MPFNDLLSTSFLFSVAIIIILIGGIFAYVSYRMSEQDHKISSMLGLISTMAEELQFFRSKLERDALLSKVSAQDSAQVSAQEELHQGGQPFILNPNNPATELVEPDSLISVSDESEEDDDDDDDDDESVSVSVSVSVSESDSESDSESESESEDGESISEYILDEIVDLEESVALDLDQILDQNLDQSNIKSIHLAEPINLNISSQEHFANDLKTISITDLEDTNKKSEYKKMSLTRLREVVSEKGLSSDTSKLKKNELLKLLGDE